jgi:hypothetical protein
VPRLEQRLPRFRSEHEVYSTFIYHHWRDLAQIQRKEQVRVAKGSGQHVVSLHDACAANAEPGKPFESIESRFPDYSLAHILTNSITSS